MRQQRLSGHRRGAALILVVVVIAALIAIGVPFLISMRLHEKSSRAFHAQLKARHLADSARTLALARLMHSHPDEERRARQARNDHRTDPEGHDGLAELRVRLPANLGGVHAARLNDHRATQAFAEVSDLRSRIDINSSGAHPIANLLGVTYSTSPLTYRETKLLTVADPRVFFSDGDPQTIDGFVRIGQELIAYRHTSETALEGLIRGIYVSTRTTHRSGLLVQDGRAFKIALDPIFRHERSDRRYGSLARYTSVPALRRIADWQLGPALLHRVFSMHGVGFRDLRSWGLDPKEIELAGLDPVRLGQRPDDAELPPRVRQRREAARRTFARTLKLSLPLLRRGYGEAALVRHTAALLRLKGDARQLELARYRARQERLARAQPGGASARWLRTMAVRQVRLLVQLRQEAPHIEALGRLELERLRPYTTVGAPTEGERWSDPQVVTHALLHTVSHETQKLRVQDARRFARGRIVRVQPLDGRPPEYRLCTKVNGAQVEVFPPLDFDYGPDAVELSCRQPSPINVHTAPRTVLQAVLTGVQSRAGLRTRDGKNVGPEVTKSQAGAIAQALIANPPKHHGELRVVLRDVRSASGIDDHAVDAVYRNALDPADPLLTRGTVPFCYTTGDVYRIQAVGVINDDAGREVGRHLYRQTVQVAPPRDLVWTIDSQADFQDRLYARFKTRAVPLHLPGRWSNLLQSSPAYLGPHEPAPFGQPSRSHAKGEGDVRPLLWREPNWPVGTAEGPRYASELPPPPPPKPKPKSTPTPPGRPYSPIIPRNIPGPPGRRPPRKTRPPAPPPLPDPGPGAPPVIRSRNAMVLPARPRPRAYAQARVRLTPPPGVLLAVGPFDEPIFVAPPALPPLEPKNPFFDPRRTPVYNLGGGPRPGALKVAHYHAFLEGAPLGKARLATEEIGARWYPLENAQGHRSLGPGTIRAWYRLDKLPGPGRRAYLFDGGKDRTIDRVSLYLVGDSQLVLEVWDEALDVRERLAFAKQGQVAPRSTRLVYTRDEPFREGNWYHIAAFLKGSERSDLALMVDGQRVGTPEKGSRLKKAIDEFTTVIELEDATQFPPSGWIRIGQARWQRGVRLFDRGIANTGLDASDRCEVLRYTKKNGHSLILEGGPVAAIQSIGKKPSVVRRRNPSNGKWVKVSKLPADVRHPKRGSGHHYEFIFQVPPPPGVKGKVRKVTLTETLGYPHDKGTHVVLYGYHSRVRNAPNKKDPPKGIGKSAVRQPKHVGGGAGVGPKKGKLQKDVIRRGGATLVQDLPEHTPTSLLYRKVSNYAPQTDPIPTVVTATDKEIPLIWLDADWPPVGIVRVTSNKPGGQHVERILYRKLNRGSRRLENCIRGVEGTAAADHHLFASVVLESITITDPSDYPERPTIADGRVYVSVGETKPEWLSIQRTQDKGLELLGLVLIPAVDSLDNEQGQLPVFPGLADLLLLMMQKGGDLGDAPGSHLLKSQGQTVAKHLLTWESWSRARGCKASARRTIKAQAKVVPTFAVRLEDSHESGPGDVVTVSDDKDGAKPAREELTIAHVASSSYQYNLKKRLDGDVGDAGDGWLIAFSVFPTRSYHGADNARLARYPVGNIHSVPNLLFGQPAFPPLDETEGTGVLQGRIDDLVSMQLEERVYAFPIPADINQGLSLREKNVDLGIYLCDEEVIAVTKREKKFRKHDLLAMVRGAMGSSPQEHSDETPAWRLEWPLVAVAAAEPTGRKAPIPLRNVPRSRAGSVNPRDGYFAVDRGQGKPYLEVRPYAEFRPKVWNPPRDRFERRAFRGAFGSGQVKLEPGDLLVDLPVRVHDRYEEQVSSLQGVFFQASKELPGSTVTRVDWDAYLPSAYTQVRVALRVDGAPGWDAQPVRAGQKAGTAGLYLFKDGKAQNLVGLRARRIEARLYLTFKPGAFYRDAWKRGAHVGALRIHYRQPTRVLRHEEKTE